MRISTAHFKYKFMNCTKSTSLLVNVKSFSITAGKKKKEKKKEDSHEKCKSSYGWCLIIFSLM